MLKKTTLITLAATTLLTGVFSATASAEITGDARYRTGASVNYLDHAGLRSAGKGIYEIKGYNHPIELSTWDSFISGETYLGTFYNPTMTATDMTNVVSTAAALDADPDITYTMYDIIAWGNLGTRTYIQVSDITDLRCDGVVEYAYEWNNVWVWGRSSTGDGTGTPQHFDVSNKNYAGEHNNLGGTGTYELSPYVQRGGSGTKWTQMRVTPL